VFGKPAFLLMSGTQGEESRPESSASLPAGEEDCAGDLARTGGGHSVHGLHLLPLSQGGRTEGIAGEIGAKAAVEPHSEKGLAGGR